MRLGLLSDLAVIGYEIFLEGDNIHYRYRKSGNPPDTVRPLIDELRRCKAEVMNILKTGKHHHSSGERRTWAICGRYMAESLP